MKILNAIHAQGIGGVDQVFRNYAEIWANNSNEVALLISDNGNDDYKNLPVKSIYKLKNFSQISDFVKLFWILLTFKPDLIFCHSNRVMKWMRILKFFTSTKSVAVNHGISFKNSLHCEYIVSINQQIADLVVASGFDETKSFVLPNTIKIDQNYQQKNLKNPPTIGIYGRIEPRKGFDILLKAGEILAKNGCDFQLKIGGFEVHKGYGLSNIKQMAKDCGIFEKCNFVGTVLDKKNFFEDVDIFCVPSREEPFGLVILEGFLFSTLVISSNTDGGKFLIKDGEDGLLFENENSFDLAQKISKILIDYKVYQILTAKAFLKLEKEFSFASLEGRMNEILQKILNHKT